MKANKYIILFLLPLYLLVSCGKKSPKEHEEEHHDEEENTIELSTDQLKTANIQMGTIEMKQISGTIKVNGLLDVSPEQKASISLPYGGFLKSTPLLPGMKVNKGQVIAKIENPDFIQIQQDYLDIQSQLEFAKAEYERQTTLSDQNVNSQKTLQAAKSNYLSLLAKFNGLDAKLKLINISTKSVEDGNFTSVVNVYSPISGYVTKVNANIGMFFSPTDVLFEIVDTKRLFAELTVFEKDVQNIKIGQKVKFILANESEERVATVYLVGREIAEDRTIQVHCKLDNYDTDLIPGTYLKAYIESGENKVPGLPDEAVVKYQGKNYVFIAADEENHFTMVEVETGNSENGYTEIIPSKDSNLNDAQIVIKGAYDLLSKMKNSEEAGGHAH